MNKVEEIENLNGDGALRRTAALLILLTAAARARIVASDARTFVANRLGDFFLAYKSSLVRLGESNATAALAAVEIEQMSCSTDTLQSEIDPPK